MQNLTRATNERLANEWKTLSHREALLEKISPNAVFKRGFALVRGNEIDAPITSVKSLANGQTIKITFADGTVSAKIERGAEPCHKSSKEANP
ncbi:MAG: hypothetical protein FWF80_06180 [Defluviitaleaceae bacterium]|nr:hypothetical protein [Defluviitaleaceae bacterium]